MKFEATSVSTSRNHAGGAIARLDENVDVNVLTNISMAQEREGEKERSLVSDIQITYLGHPKHKVRDVLDVPIESAILGLK